MQPTITIQQADVSKLDRTLRSIADTTGRGLDGIIKQATVFAVQSAAKATPQSKKLRKARNVSRMSRKARKAAGVPWWAEYEIEYWRRSGPRKVFAAGRRVSALRTIKYRGAAKAGWWGALRSMGKAQPASAGALSGVARSASTMQQRTQNGTLIGTLTTNRVRYIGKVAPRSAEIGVRAADARMRAIWLRQLERAQKQAWKSGALAVMRAMT